MIFFSVSPYLFCALYKCVITKIHQRSFHHVRVVLVERTVNHIDPAVISVVNGILYGIKLCIGYGFYTPYLHEIGYLFQLFQTLFAVGLKHAVYNT